MSGGVDSSVAAFLLQKAGWDVQAVFMINWEDDQENPEYRQSVGTGCQWEKDFEDVRRVCQKLHIPYTTFNFSDEYKKQVFDLFLVDLKAGRTPNPDVLCNQEIKFHLFVKQALRLPGVEAVATGHYAKTDGKYLFRPVDSNKDQTYFLHRIDPGVLSKIVFPLQDLTKDEVRRIAKEQGFVNANKKDSTGICFIGDIDYNSFIDQYVEKNPGEIQLVDGTVVGKHKGLHFYTIGQRRGVNIGGNGPYYVIAKDLKQNVLVVTNDSGDPKLFYSSCVISNFHYLVESLPARAEVQVRYRQKPHQATVTDVGNGSLQIDFDEPIRAVTAGQAAVLYDGDLTLGGGVIDQAS